MVCVCVPVVGYFGVYHIQQLTNLLFSHDLYKKKQNDDSPYFFFFFLVYAERFRLNVDMPLFHKVKENYLKTS